MTVRRFAGYQITCDVCNNWSVIHTTTEREFTEALANDHRAPWSRIDGKDVCSHCLGLVTTPA